MYPNIIDGQHTGQTGRSLVLTLYFALTVLVAQAQSAIPDIRFVRLGTDEGLSQSSVLAIAQDKNGFMWFGTRNGLNQYDSRRFTIYSRNIVREDEGLPSSYVISLMADRNNTLWVSTSAYIVRYDISSGRFEKVQPQMYVLSQLEDREGNIWMGTNDGLKLLAGPEYHLKGTWLSGNRINALAEDGHGGLWVASSKGVSLFRADRGGYRVTDYPVVNRVLAGMPTANISCIAEDQDGRLWLGTNNNGLLLVDHRVGTVEHFVEGQLGLPSNHIRKILRDRNGLLWVGTLKGISVIDPASRTYRTYQHRPDDAHTLSQNSIYDIYEDRQGLIWIGTYYGGLNVFIPGNPEFQVLRSSMHFSSLSSNVVSSIVEDERHNLWIGTEAEGLNYYDRSAHTFRTYRHDIHRPRSLGSNLVKALLIDREQQLWVGTFGGGLNRFEPSTGEFIRYFPAGSAPTEGFTNNVLALLEDSSGRFWVGTDSGLYLFRRQDGSFQVFESTFPRGFRVYKLLEDRQHNIWLGAEYGLYVLKKDSTRFSKIKEVAAGSVHCIQEDRSGGLWFGTGIGQLYRYQLEDRKFTVYGIKEGLPDARILGILEDDRGLLWLSTSNGLCRFDPEQRSAWRYSIQDGLPGNEFNDNSYFRNSEGLFYFGTLNGLVSFRPERMALNTYVPPVVFTGLRLFNKPVTVNDDTGLLKQNLNVVQEIVFRHDQNIFTIEFAVLNFVKPAKNRYAYRLEGFEKDWNYVTQPLASYTNLPAGKYTFLAKGANNDGIWNETPVRLSITVLPPFWRTWWAYLIYAVLLVAILTVIVRYLLVRALLKKEHEEHQAKLNFFAYISHEIRTPITLILGPLDRLLEQTRPQPALREQLVPIKNNANRLLQLVNELMDFRKVETKNMILRVAESDIVSFVYEVFLAFKDLAASRQIRYDFVSALDSIPLYFDKAQLEKVLFNLLSNAFKFTGTGGEVALFLHRTTAGVRIQVTDNGRGIPKHRLTRLFSDFYQVEENEQGHLGSGIGLSLSRSIARLHGGELTCASRQESGDRRGFTCFTLFLKGGKAHFPPATVFQDTTWSPAVLPNSSPIDAGKSGPATEGLRFTVLLAEDHDELRTFLVSTLNDRYRIIACDNGAFALETAVEAIPDLIISDVMMPQLDGLELCKRLKQDERTSHIPIILLTAMSALEQQLNGLETGADAYIVKPFNVQVLQLTARNLIASRESMRQRFRQQFGVEVIPSQLTQTDETFMNRVLVVIEQHIDDDGFDVSALAQAVGMSLPVLYKKVKALTGLSVNNYIKSIRLNRAARLLKESRLSVAEVAYSVGFADRKYFSKEFRKQFGKSPSEYTD